MRSRRVGTLTLGVALLAVGIVYLIYVFMPEVINLYLLMRLWPVVLILLGVEVLLAYFINKEEKLRYDGWAIFFILCLLCFAWSMAGAELFMRHNFSDMDMPRFYWH